MKNNQDWIRQILASLHEAANPEYAASLQKYCKTGMQVYGIRAPVLREILRKQRARMSAAPGKELVMLGKILVGSRIHEARQLAYLMLNDQPEALDAMSLEDLEELGKGMDNWASVDAYATLLAGVQWKNGKITDQAVKKWAKSEDPCWRRAALVSTIPLNLKSKGGRGDLARTLEICDQLKADPNRMVQKAISWALRELSKRYPDEVRRFIESNQSVLAVSTFSEVSKKLEDAIKKG